ncbi:NAD(P)-dependent dehydrogenase (short-subunit alcohol dehydrogenase family) [Catalinimonas alkaloidigena]|uniref:SDR family NAD(P)-dependent oxidoreductase n=1 Tax=Catalinimonas alkaloidigena TaxID=1075417 RepID=UPI002405EAF0|nr:SDR family NAD(P)-dependent oxidoreductase [Catalinimonas alkaloidigena]MDF9797067.1 NAD(P)-dependent dehydrogenase (short-subunit alcohol dehydrogenase family) [Catalinimonas alkaloidigena]
MKTIFITGSTDGIGKLTAIQLAKDGQHLLLHGRNSEKLQKTVAEIKALSDNESISGFVSDLSDFGSIKKVTTALIDQISKIDVLINNAGVFKSSVHPIQKGLDLRFAVNFFAPYLLTHELIPILKKSSSPRVINVSSAAQSSVSLAALKGDETLSAQETYAQSKLALTMWSFHLAQTLDFLNVIAVNPGSLLNTKMVQEAYGQFWSSADKGAEILYDLAISDQYSKSSGKYFDNDTGDFSEAHKDAYNQNMIARLIAETDKILGL